MLQGIKDFYERLSEQETELLLNASKKFSGQIDTTEVPTETDG